MLFGRKITVVKIMYSIISTGVEKLVGVYKERPNFADADAQEDARQRLSQVTHSYHSDWIGTVD